MAQTGPDPIIRGTDPARCSLCGAPNECAQAAGAATSGSACWCVERRFPAALLERASARDGGAACVCRRCLEGAVALEPTTSNGDAR